MDDVVQVSLEFLSEPAVGRRLPGGASKLSLVLTLKSGVDYLHRTVR